jgi:protein ImuB
VEAEATRTLVVWCADWPLVAAGVPLDVPAVVLRANRVVAASPPARACGVGIHQRRRDAQARCPEAILVPHDPAQEARAFEPVAAALEALTPRIEVAHPGTCAFPTRGPSRYHGGDEALAAQAAGLAADALRGRGPVRVGVADGPFAAGLAARRRPGGTVGAIAGVGAGAPRADAPGEDPETSVIGPGDSSAPTEATPGEGAPAIRVVAPGGSPAFLAPISVTVLCDPGGPVGAELVDVLERLGIRTLGALAALPAAEIVGRFGAEGLVAHRLARGLDPHPPATAPPPPEWTVAAELDPPALQVEAAAFLARGLADDLHRRLAAAGNACTRLAVGAESEHGETHTRVWRTEGTFTPHAIADRVRWQLHGWLESPRRPTAGLTRLWLAPDEVVPAGGRQLAFGSGAPGAVDAVEAGDRAARALARVQGLLDVEAVRMPEWRGGRGPGERVALVPVAADDATEPRPAARDGWVAEPWPGAVPPPAPAVVHDLPHPVAVVDAAGRPVAVSGRGEVSAPPAGLGPEAPSAARRPARVVAWAGPWPCDERWWDPRGHRRRARLQVVTADGAAHLLMVEAGRWWMEATYD